MKTLTSVIDTVLEYGFNLFEKVTGLSISQTKRQTLGQFVKFGIVGVSNTLLSFAIYFVAWKALNAMGLRGQARYLTAQVISFVIGVLWSFYWNNKMVFSSEKKGTIWPSLVKTFISYSFTGLFLNSILMILWVQVFGMSELLAPLLNLIISVPLNFILNKYWAFKS